MPAKAQIMPKAHIRDGELRIPLTDDIREKLDMHEGEELTAHVFEGSVTFTRTTEEARRQAGARMLALVGQVELRPGEPVLSPDEEEQMIQEEVKAYRQTRHEHR